MGRKKISIEERLKKYIKFNKSNGCLEWMGNLTKDGYGRICIDYKIKLVHRLIYELKNGPIQDNLYVLHKCDNRKCCSINHLFLGTPDDNMKDKVNKNRQAKGEFNGNSKLRNEQIIDIRNDSRPHRKIAMNYGVSQSTISDIKRRKFWNHV